MDIPKKIHDSHYMILEGRIIEVGYDALLLMGDYYRCSRNIEMLTLVTFQIKKRQDLTEYLLNSIIYTGQ